MRHELVKRPQLSSSKNHARKHSGIVRFVVLLALAVWGSYVYAGTAHASDYTSGMCQLRDSQTAHPIGMRINPCAELDTAQVIDDRAYAGLVPVWYEDVSPTTWNRLLAMGYQGDPTDGTDDVIYVTKHVAGALNRIEAGINR